MKVLLIAGFIVSLLRASNGECIMCVNVGSYFQKVTS